jgi:hypothetical protein
MKKAKEIISVSCERRFSAESFLWKNGLFLDRIITIKK